MTHDVSVSTPTEISNSDDVIDVRDVIARVEYLADTLDGRSDEELDADWQPEQQELIVLSELLEELRGNGGDEQWRGDWYPLLLVRDSHFRDFAQQEAEDLDLVKSDARWPYTCIDWEEAAEELKQDYLTVEFDGITYWYR